MVHIFTLVLPFVKNFFGIFFGVFLAAESSHSSAPLNQLVVPSEATL
jgi:hypothetical protein